MILLEDTTPPRFYQNSKADALVRACQLRRRLAGLRRDVPGLLRVVALLALLAVRLEAVAFRVLSDRLERGRS